MQKNIDKILTNFDHNQFQNDLISWFKKEQRKLPWRKDQDPYKVWVSEIMLQQTRVDTVIPYFNNFIKQFPTVHALAKAEEEKVLKAWEGLGYYSRARNLQSAVREVVTEYDGKVPNTVEEISQLKGVGPYTQGAILSIAYGIPEPAVDGNVMRVISRILAIEEDIAKPKTRKLFETIIREIISEDQPSFFNQGLMELGAIVCTPKSPSCLLCPVQNHCIAFSEGIQNDFPVKTRKKTTKDVVLATIVLQNPRGEILIHKRPNKGLLANLWEFPTVEMTSSTALQIDVLKHFMKNDYKMDVLTEEHLFNFKHEFSHLIWKIAVYKGHTNSETIDVKHSKFVTLAEMESYPFPVPYQKIIEEIKSEH
ncbi:A/G-specific adenine glycosylase [Bacillus sp. Marseille-P3661]|uniref:A/G-specific adenine glycosylase n=1 Tax=Bacillus sp. Marseille-P3661 TaxID=1936234 RepID=UPI000C857167|nr:A/G-specific adenine glycosylase [Bacillus sp. Marseille-P3661]